MDQPPKYKPDLYPNIGAPSAPPADPCNLQTTDEKRPLNSFEDYNHPQEAGLYNPPYPEPPPPYSPPGGGYNQPPTAGSYAQPPASYAQPPASYPQPPASYAQPPPASVIHTQQPGVVIATQQAPPATAACIQPTQVVVVGGLTPGTCSVCRRGKIKKSPSCCTWICCILLLPCFIIPGIIAYFCCCQKPKCTHCGYSP
ncbi:uncharacterized protein [Procambarus clarkii]|uniref:uncharacterized protein n=1 Tax=Procambarus clarkii TaxID=6728 RepID=UPI001E67753D|nr:extensin-like isoform X2 [Procambarus clarkii]XP_045608048.1 extensin-like isoform X2 [Procambarus clarkii]XP_045608049.1 extensin-like isoform X2 [Procambarus clarkii]XP_045608050.1 extensin-like isoform X2 [Procambarus clarkii]XP_045608051.1 extensin-like isoform X2 [Procambarus clarkii]XP_045608052.1 extensin-like isoform X2 [Procambarus clarkii]